MTVVVNGSPRDLATGTTVAELVEILVAGGAGRVLPARGVAVALNGSVVPRAEWAGTALGEGDRVEVLTAVQGG